MHEYEVYTLKSVSGKGAQVEVRITFEDIVSSEKRNRIEEAENNLLKAVREIMDATEDHTV